MKYRVILTTLERVPAAGTIQVIEANSRDEAEEQALGLDPQHLRWTDDSGQRVTNISSDDLIVVAESSDMKTQAELTKAHGTPEEFERAVWAAEAQLFCTHDEAVKAITKYREEWNAAPA